MMQRTLEPEVMESAEGAAAYAAANFSASNQAFAEAFLADARTFHKVLDLGCGPGDIALSIATSAPRLRITGADASEAMLSIARENVAEAGLSERVEFILGRIPGIALPDASFDAVISNSLLHHIPEPAVFWTEAKRLLKPKGTLFVMDLLRPSSKEEAQRIVDKYAAAGNPVLREDFLNSLLAAFTLDELREQLASAGLTLKPKAVSDRHWRVNGTV